MENCGPKGCTALVEERAKRDGQHELTQTRLGHIQAGMEESNLIMERCAESMTRGAAAISSIEKGHAVHVERMKAGSEKFAAQEEISRELFRKAEALVKKDMELELALGTIAEKVGATIAEALKDHMETVHKLHTDEVHKPIKTHLRGLWIGLGLLVFVLVTTGHAKEVFAAVGNFFHLGG
jgi:hypothetical protein